jgi:hypothetical protein
VQAGTSPNFNVSAWSWSPPFNERHQHLRKRTTRIYGPLL